MVKRPRFLDLYYAGRVDAGEIEEYIEAWSTGNSNVSLHVFLGMTWWEYGDYGATGVLPTQADHERVPQQDVVFVGVGSMPLYVHGPSRCEPPCPVHWPSDHPQASWPLGWNARDGIMMRLCTHVRQHPDPDDQHLRQHPELAEHDCDGCCRPTIDEPPSWLTSTTEEPA